MATDGDNGSNNSGNNNGNEQYEEPGWEELVENRAEEEMPNLVFIEPLQFARPPGDVIIQLTNREARDQNGRNERLEASYRGLVADGNNQGQRRLERGWQRMERQRDAAAGGATRRTQDMREEQLAAAMTRCQLPPTDKEEKK